MGIYGKLSGGDITLPKIYPTDVLSEKRLEFIANHVPEPHAATGCPAYSNRELLPGILKCCVQDVGGVICTHQIVLMTDDSNSGRGRDISGISGSYFSNYYTSKNFLFMRGISIGIIALTLTHTIE